MTGMLVGLQEMNQVNGRCCGCEFHAPLFGEGVMA
jgi:hypothetical protein